MRFILIPSHNALWPMIRQLSTYIRRPIGERIRTGQELSTPGLTKLEPVIQAADVSYASFNYWLLLFMGVIIYVVYAILRSSLDNVKREYELKTNAVQRQYRQKEETLEKEYERKRKDLQLREKVLNERDEKFREGFLSGRKWLAAQFAEIKKAEDEAIVKRLIAKKHPAFKAATRVKTVAAERREALERLKFLEYQLKSYEEYFPFLEEYREVILDERVPLGSQRNNVQEIANADPVLKFISKRRYEELSSAQRNQLALEAYLRKRKTAWQVGIAYERYIGYLYESHGWRVEYKGALEGLEDFGRDLICSKGNETRIIQAKNWRIERTIREKHLFQLFGTALLYKLQCSTPDIKVLAYFYSGAAPYSNEALAVAKELGINTVIEPYTEDYPMIKCNINQATKEKIYHLPFDQQYDRVVIKSELGEFYAKTAQEAEGRGFRRAFRYHGPF
jgi:hypothetical protein